MPEPIVATSIETTSDSLAPAIFKQKMGPAEGRNLGDHFGLTRMGVRMETLPPGSMSALRHWHSHSDEFIYVLEGALTLVDEAGGRLIQAGGCVGFKGGDDNGHHLVNHSGASATFLVAGTRHVKDVVTYPDGDLAWRQDGETWRPVHRDGTPYQV